MRLLHTVKLTLRDFFDTPTPEYAILSHRWGSGEVSIDDLRRELGRSGQGWAKIQGVCRQAAADGFEYCVRYTFKQFVFNSIPFF